MLNISWSVSENSQSYNPIGAIDEELINEWTSSLKLVIDNEADTIALKANIKADKIWYIDGERRLQTVENKVLPPFPVGCWLIIEEKGNTFQIDLPKYPYMVFEKIGDEVVISFTVKDIASIGLPFWGSEKIKKDPRGIELNVTVYRLDSPKECAWVEPYPNGAKAAICLTDHADWDSSGKLEQLVDLFEKYDFKFTKSIFPHSDPQGYKQEPGLDDPEFKKQVDRLDEMGTEIAYHGLSPRVNPPSYDVCLKRIADMEIYLPRTWIDHGTGNYLFSRSALFSNGIGLVELMGEHGIRNYWSYIDIWENPANDLNVWKHRTAKTALSDVVGLLMNKGLMGLKQFVYIAVGLLKNIFGGSQYRQLKKIWKPSVFKKLTHHATKLKGLHQKPFVLYDEFGQFALNNINGIWVFDTILLNHLALQLSPEAVDSLVKDNGLLLAHCYMGAQHKYGGSNCFNQDVQKPVLLNVFEDNIAYISRLQKNGDVISLSFEELRQCYVDFVETKLVRENGEWITTGNATIQKRKIK